MSLTVRARVAASLVAAPVTLLLAVAASSPATAAIGEGEPVVQSELAFTGTSTFVYGEEWVLTLSGAYAFSHAYKPNAITPTISGAPSGYKVNAYGYGDYAKGTMTGQVAGEWDQDFLPAGTYPVKVTGSALVFSGTEVLEYRGADETTLTIEKIPLSVETRVLQNPESPTSAVIGTRLAGTFVDNYFYYPYYEGRYVHSPGGTWTITVKDSEGATVFEEVTERTDGDHTLGASAIWNDAEAGEQYVASAVFSPNAGSAKNFAVEPSNGFEFTGADSARTVAASDAGDPTASEPPVEPDFSVPVWWVILIGLALLALIGCAVVFAVRLGGMVRDAKD